MSTFLKGLSVNHESDVTWFHGFSWFLALPAVGRLWPSDDDEEEEEEEDDGNLFQRMMRSDFSGRRPTQDDNDENIYDDNEEDVEDKEISFRGAPTPSSSCSR